MNMDERIERLEARVGRWQVFALILTGALAASSLMWWSKLDEIDISDEEHFAQLHQDKLRFGDTTIDEDGISIEGLVEHLKKAHAYLKADESGGRLAIGTSDVSIELTTNKTSIASVSFRGKITSQLLVDTDSGAWTLNRFRAGADGAPISDVEVTQLVPPMPKTMRVGP